MTIQTMASTYRRTILGRVFTIDTTPTGRSTYRIDGKRMPVGRWEAAHSVAEGTEAWHRADLAGGLRGRTGEAV